VSRSVI